MTVELNRLPKIVKKTPKRVGRGYGSGKGGHTTGRGTKGQGARGSVAQWFEGGQLPMIRRFPFTRGKSRFKTLGGETLRISLDQLNKFKVGSEISFKSLTDKKIISKKDVRTARVKVLAQGKLEVALKVLVPCSKQAELKIIKAGGSVENEQSPHHN
jgi:large subunit ribosomal protein L15